MAAFTRQMRKKFRSVEPKSPDIGALDFTDSLASIKEETADEVAELPNNEKIKEALIGIEKFRNLLLTEKDNTISPGFTVIQDLFNMFFRTDKITSSYNLETGEIKLTLKDRDPRESLFNRKLNVAFVGENSVSLSVFGKITANLNMIEQNSNPNEYYDGRRSNPENVYLKISRFLAN